VQLPDAWIETVAEQGTDRTSWTVRLGGKTLSARAWAHQNASGVAFMWSHRRDAAGGVGSSLSDG
jgi:hypothetical protein